MLKIACMVWAVGALAHTGDHIRMGYGPTPWLVAFAGPAQVLLGLYGLWRMGRGDSRGLLYAVVAAVALVITMTAVHVPPYWGDGVFSQPAAGWHPLQQITLGMAIFASAVLTAVGVRELRAQAR